MPGLKKLDDPRDVEIARLRARVAELEPTKPARSSGKQVSYDWKGIENKVRADGQMNRYFSRTMDIEGKPGFLFDRAKYLHQNKLPSPTYKFLVQSRGPKKLEPSTLFAVDESDAVNQVVQKQIGNDDAHRYTHETVRV